MFVVVLAPVGRLPQLEWPEQVLEDARPEVIFSVLNINKAAFLGSFKVIVFHQVRCTREEFATEISAEIAKIAAAS